MKDLLILNDVNPENSIGGQATFIKNLLPFLKKYYNPQVLILPERLLNINFIPRRFMYLLFLCSKTKSIRKHSLILSNTAEASFYVSLVNPKALYHIFHGNNNPVTTSKFWYGKYFRFVFDYFDRRILKKAKVCITVGESRTNTIKINQPINKIVIDVIPDSIDRKNLLFVGRLEEVKQIDKIISHFRAYINAHPEFTENLIICGEGIKEAELRKAAHDLNIANRVLFTGRASYDEVITLMKNSRILVMASSYEGFPMVIAEALCCGLPVISTNVGSISDAIIDDYNGYLVPLDHSEADYGDAINKILQNPEKFRANAEHSSSVFNAAYLVSNTFKPLFDDAAPVKRSATTV